MLGITNSTKHFDLATSAKLLGWPIFIDSLSSLPFTLHVLLHLVIKKCPIILANMSAHTVLLLVATALLHAKSTD